MRDIPYEGWRDYTLGMGAVLRNIIRISSPRDLGQSRYQQKGGKLVAAYGIDRKTGKIVKKKPRKQAKKNRT